MHVKKKKQSLSVHVNWANIHIQLLSQVDQLKEENVRLQEESQTAAQQLRRFTEWFFQTIDKS